MNRIHRRLLRESLREIGVLVLVFVPLDMVVEGRAQPDSDYPHWMFWLRWLSTQHWEMLFFAALGIILLCSGIKTEAESSIEDPER